MSRGLSGTNEAHIEGTHVHEVILVKLEFDTPVYAHSGFGTISYDGDDYLGVGDFGSVSESRESELLGPNPFQLTLSGIDSALLSESLNSGAYGDAITVYSGYRSDDGTLIDDPWVVARGKFEYASLSRSENNSITIVAQNNLAILDEVDGSRFSDEDQRQRYVDDEGFEYVEENAVVKLLWGGRPHTTGNSEDYDEWDPRRDR